MNNGGVWVGWPCVWLLGKCYSLSGKLAGEEDFLFIFYPHIIVGFGLCVAGWALQFRSSRYKNSTNLGSSVLDGEWDL